MDTLFIVRKIREAEALADSGDHGGARGVLEPLLLDAALTDAHRHLIARKLDLFNKRQQRLTRIVRQPSETSESTAIIDPTERSNRPTDVLGDDTARGVATEVVPKATEPQRKSRVPTLRIDELESAAADDFTPEINVEPTRRDTERTGPLPEVPAPGPGKPPTGNYFGRQSRSDPELNALAAQLPDGDLRRELAVEVVKLREELDRLKASPAEPPERSLQVPPGQDRTTVRTDAGIQDINVPMPSRNEEGTELKVLRRESVRGFAVPPAPPPHEEHVAGTADLAGAEQALKSGPFKRVVIVLGLAIASAVVLIAGGMFIKALLRALQQ